LFLHNEPRRAFKAAKVKAKKPEVAVEDHIKSMT